MRNLSEPCGRTNSRAEFYDGMQAHAFTVAPLGTALDTYRVWETLMAGEEQQQRGVGGDGADGCGRL